MFLSIIIFHELGHILAAIYFNWNIERIVLLPFGGITIFNENIDKPLYEEFIICMMGPIFQITYYCLTKNIWDIKIIHYNLLIFNLLPIIPLDGSKIMNLLLNKILNFKNSLLVTNLISVLFIIIIELYALIYHKIVLLLVLIFLILKTIEQINRYKYIINRFILEHLYSPAKNVKIKYIIGENPDNMYRDKKHIFIIKNKPYTERQIIKKRFDLSQKLWYNL